MAVVGIDNDTPLVANNIIVIVEIQRICELRFQSWVTLCDVKRIGVVGDLEQLRHIGLTGISAIVDPEVTLIAELIMEVKCWSQIGDIADGVDIDTTIVLNEVRVLGLYKDADIIIIFLLTMTQREPQVVGVVLVLRKTTQVLVKVARHLRIER